MGRSIENGAKWERRGKEVEEGELRNGRKAGGGRN